MSISKNACNQRVKNLIPLLDYQYTVVLRHAYEFLVITKLGLWLINNWYFLVETDVHKFVAFKFTVLTNRQYST
ncbi:hypothetical protein RIR_jg12094.t1 [Rhizophagus irregularis DAOM 181602=DAOM 197198]|nr:hypothetical protein RIR_jg12094.t1 [Rhizophagus irregularis DAOM 181602=DAOM 197198]